MGRIMKGLGRVMPAEALDARTQAAALLQAARREAAEVHAAVARARDEARAEGYQVGEQAGREAARAELASVLSAARAECERAIEAARQAAVPLATKMAEKIVGRAVDLSPEVMAEIAEAALLACRDPGTAVLMRVHPDDLAAVAARRAELGARLSMAAGLAVVEDENVGRYGCVIETAFGHVDARLSRQLAALEDALTGA